MTFLKLLMRRIFIALSIRTKGTASSDKTLKHTQQNGYDQLFNIKAGGIWSDDVASPVRGGRRFREEERFSVKPEVIANQDILVNKEESN